MSRDTTLGRANVELRATLDKLDGDLGAARGRVSGAVKGMVSSAGKSFQAIGTAALAGIGAATTAVAGLAAGLAKVTIDAAPVEGIKAAFEGISESANIAGDDMLAALQKGSSGMIAERDLMTSFNKAASLVSTDFATHLPDAMQYLGKVSAATGDDMAYLMNSLVVGVGRVSPMILDNLGIQVSLSEATERAAEMFGVEASALDKTQQQAGMMDVVLGKLKDSTAAMPDVTETATAKLARMKAQFQDTKDKIGVVFLPVLKSVMDIFGMIAEKVFPVFEGVLEKIGPKIKGLADDLSWLIEVLFDAGPGSVEFKEALTNFIPRETVDAIYRIIDGIKDFIYKVGYILNPIIEWVKSNVQLKDVLLVLAVAIASVVLPILWSLVATMLPIIAVFLAAVAIVALFRNAWESDWMGMKSKFTEFWEGSVKPKLQELWSWLQEKVPEAIETLKGYWENTLLPALKNVWEWMKENIIPIFESVADWLKEKIPEAIGIVAEWWENTFIPALENFRDFAEEYILPLFEAIGEFLGVLLVGAIDLLVIAWDTILQPALQALWSWLGEKVLPVLKDLYDFIMDPIKEAFEKAGGWAGIFTTALDKVKSATQWLIDKIKELKDKLMNLDIPDWIKPGSPTPFELGLKGIRREMGELNRMELKQFKVGLESVGREGAVMDYNTGAAIDAGNLKGGSLSGIEDVLNRILGAQGEGYDERRLGLLIRDALLQAVG